MFSFRSKNHFMVQAAIIAALYTTLSFIFAPISYGLIQIRVSEALTILPFFTPAAIPGLFIGCMLSNAIGVALGMSTVIDVIFGSLATLIAAYLSYRLRRSKWLVPLPPIVVNAVVIGIELCYVFNVGAPLYACMLYVALGQVVCCYAMGIPLIYALKRADDKLAFYNK